ncbi:MAG: hypothetical protein ABW352_18795 [Polyangiales bacterium]
MISSRVVPAIACLLLLSCGGRAPGPTHTGGPVSADAPSWARVGDSRDDDGALFVCEGAGPDEAQAIEAARALCSAKICELCGVEVKSTVETKENLQTVEVERKVVETCRRVRKSEEQIRYRQAGCGPSGCTAWLQVFFGKEDEARECRAYADGNFADSTQCEELIERFRSTPDRTAESFRVRADILTQAIVACAEIDVRPTPKLTALDEILWQGVLGPRTVAHPRRPIDKAQSVAERLKVIAANTRDAWKADYADRAYGGIDRQPLLESKVFVDRIAIIRDAMVGYATIMTVMEAVVDAEQTPDAAHDAALVRGLRGLKPVAGQSTPERVLAWAADEISRNPNTLAMPGIKAYFMEAYPAHGEAVGYALMRAMMRDARTSDDEWKYAMSTMRDCFTCGTRLLDLPEHGSEATRIARLVELSKRANTEQNLKALAGINPEFLLRGEPSLDAALAARLFTYEWFEPFLEKLPTVGRDTLTPTLRDTFTSTSQYDWRWLVTPAQHKVLAARAWQLWQPRASTLRCDDLDKPLTLLEKHGVDTRAQEQTLCKCVAEGRRDGMRDVTELYQRLVAWGASCTGKEGP